MKQPSPNDEGKRNVRKIFGHIRLVLTHKYWVFHYCRLAGIPLRGLLHDLSKFSPTEFGESIRYYSGVRSPIRDARRVNGHSIAWLHHRGRNRHHYEYWVDNTPDGNLVTVPIPFKDALELICDRLGAARAYLKKDFVISGQLDRVDKEIDPSPWIHPQTKRFIRRMFEALATAETPKEFKKRLRSARTIYDQVTKETPKDGQVETFPSTLAITVRPFDTPKTS